jgi:hypothetical protein
MEVKSYHLSQFEIGYVEWGAGIIDRGTYEFEKNVDLVDLQHDLLWLVTLATRFFSMIVIAHPLIHGRRFDEYRLALAFHGYRLSRNHTVRQRWKNHNLT